MQTFKLWCIFFIVISFSCKDKPEEVPVATANINDILGPWVSVDSSITERDGKFYYARDTLFVKKRYSSIRACIADLYYLYWKK